jgi:OmcA/MtrC family decaheme c-type cytochrome
VAGIEKPLESCAVCHGDNSLAAVDDAHAVTGIVTVSGVKFTESGTDLLIDYSVKIDGVAKTGFTKVRTGYRLAAAGAQTDILTASAVTDNGGGAYTLKVTGGATAPIVNSRYLFRISDAGETKNISLSGDYPAAPRTDLVSAQACNNCHSDDGIQPHTFKPYDYASMVASECVVCHTGSIYSWVPDNWVGMIHGIHNSHNMPDGEYVFRKDNPATTTDEKIAFEVTYPTYMTNCSVCHDSTTTLAAANTMTVTGENCLSCHGSMESWDFEEAGLSFHDAYTEATDCTVCHNSSATAVAPANVRAFHDGLETERIGIIYGGQDLSVSEGKKFTWQITNIVDDKTNLKISWTATYNGNSINPCNTTPSATAPVVFPFGPNTGGEGTLSMLRSYVQGDDYVLGKASGPGQASATNLSTTNTVCAGNVATTTILVDSGVAAGTRGVVALQGKWQIPVPAGMSKEHWSEPLMFVRVPTPTEEWIVGSSGIVAKASQRRQIADTADCLKCHVGSLYQHGNTRVDNVQMCVICHNSASSDQNNRVTMGVDKTEAYDGRVGQTYEFKTMLHALHTAAEQTKTLAIYRTRGIYAWAPEGVTPPNWTTAAACKVVSPIAPATTPAAFVDVAPFEAVPAGMQVTTTGNIVNGASKNADGTTYPTVACQVHNLYHPTYPRLFNDCAACHTATFSTMVDQTKGVATTIDAGVAPFNNQLDDSLQGANAAACTSCHQDAASVGHAEQNGWTPTKFPNGRQTIIDAAK